MAPFQGFGLGMGSEPGALPRAEHDTRRWRFSRAAEPEPGLVGRNHVPGLRLRPAGEHLCLVARERGALVELAVDLPAELPH